ncbi:toll/interleukin-1 receptor domain-containing protein [Gluconacetobacter sp. 1c LMG 22058]|uniref:Toll/interleukin-1 receptor domain-containing protein n=1 Tax=Gluconacetobacter dulcium TaxID=2729096 RepID=A0A7W4K3I6_9PROT|nr:toll/interleukin-1 receptor domain-containing protein [Gluconacetobacter dulcium]MBB2199730.1 toll/interleukin-1 receptor domain-containing protein [Gluconacetobacter dulcium]
MADLFISYAWTSPAHREWVRLLASQLHFLGYDVKIDEQVDYGSSLSGFMQEVTSATHVLLIVDENYVLRADTMPDSGVGIENRWISGAFSNKPTTWLSLVFVQNSLLKVPAWLSSHSPKGFDFNSTPEKNVFPGSVQIDEIWRWVEGLPASKGHATSLAEVRKRAARIERIDAQRDPANYASPALKGRVTFRHKDHRHFKVGNGEYEFKINFSGRSRNGVYVYIDSGLKAVGLITASSYDPLSVSTFLTPARSAEPIVGQSEPPRVYRRVKHSKDEPYDEPEIHRCLSC